MDFVNPFPEPLWRKRKSSRSEWRASHSQAPSRPHGGRGKKYGFKAGKQRRHKKSAL